MTAPLLFPLSQSYKRRGPALPSSIQAHSGAPRTSTRTRQKPSKMEPTAPPAADAASAPPPLTVAWPQVKAFVSMAQEALRAKAAAHEVSEGG